MYRNTGPERGHEFYLGLRDGDLFSFLALKIKKNNFQSNRDFI